LISKAGFWKRALTPAEITDLYNEGDGRDYAYIVDTSAGDVVVFDNHASVYDTSGGTTDTLAFAVGSREDRLLIVFIGTRTSLDVPTGVTYNGVAMAFGARYHHNYGGPQVQIDMWYLMAPDSGTNNIVITKNNPWSPMICAISFSGVHQTVPFGTFVQLNDNPSITVSSAADEVVIDIINGDSGGPADPAPAPGAGQVLRNSLSSGGAFPSWFSVSTEDPGAASTVMSWTNDYSNNMHFGFGIKPAPFVEPPPEAAEYRRVLINMVMN